MAVIVVRLFASHPFVTDYFAHQLAPNADLVVNGTQQRCQVGVFDSEMNSLLAAVQLAVLRYPSMRPMLLCPQARLGECLRWMLQGFWGAAPYDRWEQELADGIRLVARGIYWFPASVVRQMATTDRRRELFAPNLSMREQQVLGLLLGGLSLKEIASALQISLRTVKFHLSHIYSKLHVKSRHDLAALRA